MEKKNKDKKIKKNKKKEITFKKVYCKSVEKRKKEERKYLETVLTKEQLEKYDNASDPQKVWLLTYCTTGDCRMAEQAAYPKMKQPARYTMTYRNRNLFDISMADILRNSGVDEMKIAQKIELLLDAKRIKKTYVKGDLRDEITEEDSFSVSKGIDYATKHLKIDPGTTVIHEGGDSIMAVINAAANDRKKD